MAIKPENTQLDIHSIVRPLPGNREDECGDTTVIIRQDNHLFLGMIDALGHGRKAHELAITCKVFLQKNFNDNLVELFESLDDHIKGSIGVVAALSHLDLETGELNYAGIGDITTRIFGENEKRFVSRSGVIGYMPPKAKVSTFTLCDNDILMLYSDGVRAHFVLKDYPELMKDDAKTVASNIIDKFGKQQDDAGCIVLRYKK